jgi:hypothetical protein
VTASAERAAPGRWREHLLRHGPADREERDLLLELARYADEAGRTGWVEDNGDVVEARLRPCRECGLGLDT